jgi:hypothetical protein
MIDVVAIDIDCLHGFLLTLSNTESLQKVLATGVTTNFLLRQLDHSGWVYSCVVVKQACLQ